MTARMRALRCSRNPPSLDASATGNERRVRVLNDQSSRRENFELVWVDEQGKETGDAAGGGLRSARREPRGARAPAQGFRVVLVCSGCAATRTDSTTRFISRMNDETRRPSSTSAPIAPTIPPDFSITSNESSSTLRGARFTLLQSASDRPFKLEKPSRCRL